MRANRHTPSPVMAQIGFWLGLMILLLTAYGLTVLVLLG